MLVLLKLSCVYFNCKYVEIMKFNIYLLLVYELFLRTKITYLVQVKVVVSAIPRTNKQMSITFRVLHSLHS